MTVPRASPSAVDPVDGIPSPPAPAPRDPPRDPLRNDCRIGREPASRDPMDPSKRLPLWPTLRRREGEDHGIFRVDEVERRSPRTDRVGTYKVLEVPAWVNVVALTRDADGPRIVLVEQYRHGLDDLTLEIPGGMVDPGEDPADAAARELREETGFAGGEPVYLGTVRPNPAFQTNECHTYLVPDARRVGEIQPDEGEHLRVVLEPLAAVSTLVRDRRIDHALVVCAFHWLHLRGFEGLDSLDTIRFDSTEGKGP